MELGDELLGINVSTRRISTIKKTLYDEGGLMSGIIDEKLENMEKLDYADKKPVQMIEIILEKLDSKGQKTYCLEKKFLPEDDKYKILKVLLKEWDGILELDGNL